MAGKHKPIQLSEVPREWHKYILWDEERKYIKGKGFHVYAICPQCGGLHWVKETCLRKDRYQSLRCQGCNARKELTLDEVNEDWATAIQWDRPKEKVNGKWAVWVKCSFCGKLRLIKETVVRGSLRGAGMCRDCSRKARNGKKSEHWAGGRYSESHGYIILNVNGLEGHTKEIASKMAHGDGKTIREHRLVMALHLGRSLTKDEIVHHVDGNKANNAIENLRLLTKKKHHHGHGDSYYQKWQEALSRIRELETEMEILKG